jgi:hypothetical protein
MQDNALIQLISPLITSALIADGYTGVILAQSYQPTQQGVSRLPMVFMQKIYTHRYGWGRSYTKWNPLTLQEELNEDQWIETTFQFSALVTQSVQTPNQYTASDLANEVAAIVQSQAFQVALMAQNVGILRVSEIRNPWFQDDRDQFEALPSFDLVLSSLQTRLSTVPVVSSFIINVHRE